MPLDINAFHAQLGITETYQMPDALKTAMLNPVKREPLLELVAGMADGNGDPLRDYFQENHSNREAMKQDYTPDSLCELIARLAPHADSMLDMCAGTGSLSLAAAHKTMRLDCEEVSTRSIPMLMLNLALKNQPATILEKDVITRETRHAYRITPGPRFGNVTETQPPSHAAAYGLIASNPPYSLKWSGDGVDERFFGWDMPPKSKADYVFILDALSRLDDNGTAIFILPHGVLFRGANEGKIRAALVERNHLDAVIGLPGNLFMNTGIPVCVIILRKNRDRHDTFIMDASTLCEKHGKLNRLNAEHVNRIIEAYENRQPIDRLANVASLETIRANGYNLNIPRYVDTYQPAPLPSLGDIMNDLMTLDRQIADTQRSIADDLSQLTGSAGGVDYRNDTGRFIRYLKGEAA